MRATSNLPFGDRREPPFDLVDPRCARGCEVQVEARLASQPIVNHRRLVSAIVVQHQMNVEVLRNGFGDVVEEPAKLHRPVAREASAEHLTGGYVQGRKQRRGSVAAVVVGAPLRKPWTHRQHRLATLQRLNLRLLVHAQHHRALGRMQVQTHDVAYLLDEQRIARQLEGLATMRLQTERTPDAAYRRRTQSTRLGHRARAPMRSTCRDRLQGLHHHPLHVVVPNRARRSRSRLVQ